MGKKKSKNSSENSKGVGKRALSLRQKILRFAIKFSCAFLFLIFFIPACLLLIYKLEFVHPVSTLMVQEKLVGAGAKRDWVDFEDIAPVLYQTVLSSEDGKFCAHNGIDWEALNSVIEDAIDGQRTRGASTITMQLVKNLFLWPERSFIRKGLEIPYAMMAELILSKRRIMEIYLNIVELDKGIFGVEAAAKHYFKRSAAKLGPKYSSLLAVTLPNPKGRNAAKPTRSMNRIARILRSRARASGAYIKCLQEKAD